ncbi:RNA polymerase sigma factor [Arachidicoccus sp.]|uniref:RNA polymerase sigma factor n=1 Tax=Arachidicoccus sp. TaxID=1872624 RepID=UPI003D24A99A
MSSFQQYTDEQLLLALDGGSENAFTEIFYRYDSQVHHFILKMVKDVSFAEELTQQVFIKVWEKRSLLKNVKNLRAYLLTISSNLVINNIKKQLSEKSSLENLFNNINSQRSSSSDEILILKDTESIIEKAIQLLPRQQKNVFNLSRKQGMSNDEIAKELNISKFTVKYHLAEAVKGVKKYLQQHEQISSSFLIILSLLYIID